MAWPKTKIWHLSATVLGVLGLDQLTKILISAYLAPEMRLELISGFFSLVHTRNDGVAFGLLAGGHPFKLAAVALVALAPLVWLVHTAGPRAKTLVLGVGLMLGGAWGNILDRLRLGFVVDFLDFSFRRYHWPAFNVADIAVVAGCFLMVIHILRADDGPGRQKKAG